ncbi:MAG: tetratricopeptide repeat protein [Alistipes sp.]|nr:tetratricopeptide repeat protein [Alistipes sp.]
MRYILSTFFALLFSVAAMAQDVEPAQSTAEPAAQSTATPDNNALWESGNKAYIDGNFAQAVADYSAIESRGYYSARLYYNMGNAYFKLGQLGKAILYYHRALVISPSMDDAQHNLEIAQAQTKDNIAQVPQFFLHRWLRTVQSTMSCTAWSVISLSLFALTLALLLVFLLGTRLAVRKTGFFGAIASLLLFVVTTAFAISERNDVINRQGAIVISSAISVKSSPDRAATDLFVLHEGTKVTISSQVEDWAEITIADGKKGWTELSHLEQI